MNTDHIKKVILIVEDEVIIAADLNYLLKNLGYKVDFMATSALEAIEIVKQENIDLILMDIVLDGEMDGIDASEIIRDRWGVPVVFLTAYEDSERLERAKLTYPFGYILKPFQERDLKITIEMALFAAGEDRKRKEMEKALREKEELYRIMIETSPDPIIMTDLKAELIIANTKALEAYAYTSIEEARKSRPQTLSALVEKDRDRYVLDVLAAFDQGRAVTGEYTAIKADGTIFPAEISTSVYRNLEGEAQNVISIIRDLTERKKAEQKIEESRELYRRLLEASPEAILVTDMHAHPFIINNQGLKLYGLAGIEEIQAEKNGTLTLLAREDWDRFVLNLIENYEAGQVRVHEYTAIKRDGVSFSAEISATVFCNYDGEPVGTISIVRDITERKSHEAAINRSEKKYEILFNSINDYLYSHDFQGRIIKVNQAAWVSLGYRPGEMIGRPVTDFMLPKYRELFFSSYMNKIKNNGHDEGVFQLVDKNGNRHYLEYRNTVISMEGEEPSVTGVGRDITERVMAERELRLMEEQVFQLQKMEAVGTLAGGIAHDFNNLLQTLNIYTEIMVLDKKENDPDLPNLLAIQKAGQEAAGLVKQLLLFSRKTKADHRPLDLNRQVESVLRLLEQSLPEGIEIEFHPGQGLWTVKADHVQIKQVLMNLGNNSADAMPSGGRLTFFTENVILDNEFVRNNLKTIPGNYVLITVTDTGRGMDKNTLEHIFEPFYTTKEMGRGTGLGLASAYGIIKSHGGRIVCTSQKDQGTTFKIYLPAFKTNNISPMQADEI